MSLYDQYRLLEMAIELIEDGSHFCVGNYAQDLDGNPCSSWNVKAARFCVMGALKQVSFVKMSGKYTGVIYDVKERLNTAAQMRDDSRCIEVFSDAYPLPQVIKLMREVLAEIKEELLVCAEVETAEVAQERELQPA